MDTKELEQEVRKYSGEDGEEIIEAIRKLADVDLKIKSALDEIEPIEESLPPKHNEIANQINELIKKVCDGEAKEPDPSTSDGSTAEGKHEKPERTTKKIVKVEVHVVKTPPMPLALMALMDFLNS